MKGTYVLTFHRLEKLPEWVIRIIFRQSAVWPSSPIIKFPSAHAFEIYVKHESVRLLPAWISNRKAKAAE